MSEMIEQLKNNKVCFGELSAEEKEVFNKVGPENCLLRHHAKWMALRSKAKFYHHFTYKIRSDYQPDQEYVDLEIVENDGWLGADSSELPNSPFQANEFVHLHCLLSMPGFVGFWEYDEVIVEKMVLLSSVAIRRKYHTVYARIEKNNG